MQKNLQAPKKRDELFGESSVKNARAQEYENMSICEFRLESSSKKGNSFSDGSSTGDSSRGERQQALEEMRGQW